jgi:hypothetical protein
LQFDKNIPVIALPSILKKMRKWGHYHKLMTLEEVSFTIQVLKTKNALVHKAYLIESSQNKIVYAPHGAVLKNIPNVKIDAVISTTLCYQLPFFLGGTINLGLGKALQLQKQLKAELLIDTHNEDKKGEGLVSWFAQRKFSKDAGVVNLKTGELVELNGVTL